MQGNEYWIWKQACVCIIQYPSKGAALRLSQNGHMNIRIFVRGRVNIFRWVGVAADRESWNQQGLWFILWFSFCSLQLDRVGDYCCLLIFDPTHLEVAGCVTGQGGQEVNGSVIHIFLCFVQGKNSKAVWRWGHWWLTGLPPVKGRGCSMNLWTSEGLEFVSHSQIQYKRSTGWISGSAFMCILSLFSCVLH